MKNLNARLIGVELYFKNLNKAKYFYFKTLGLDLTEEQKNHYVQFDTKGGFICLEKKGVENYPSKDKAVIFIEVSDIKAAIQKIGEEHIIKHELTGSNPWAVLHDPEGYNVLLLQAATKNKRNSNSTKRNNH